MGLKSKKILGISVTTETKETILEYIEKYLKKSSEKSCIIATPNPEQIVAAQKNKRFARILNQADVTLPDGIGLAFVVKQKRIPGVEFVEDLVKLAAIRGYTIGLIGGRGNIAVEALECLQVRHPGLKGWVLDPGDVDVGNLGNLGDLQDKIQKTNTKIVFVGLGAPKQEYFIDRIKRQVSGVTPAVLMSVGGSFDILAGRVARAPHAMQAFGLEWLWRLVCEPWRWKRQLRLLQFLQLVIRERGSCGLSVREVLLPRGPTRTAQSRRPYE